MHAPVNDQTMWFILASAFLAALWFATRAWIRSRSGQTLDLRRRLTDGSLSPRGQHYYFAHSALRTLAFEDPERLVAALCGPDPEPFLAQLWEAVGKDVAASGERGDEGARVAPDGLEVIPAHVSGRPAAVVILPPPRAATEAHFVAVVLNHEFDDPAKPAPEPHVYYFTLEKGFTVDAAASRTAFCEWDGATHKNYGDGPAPDARAFLNRIADHLAGLPARTPRATSNSNRQDSLGSGAA